MIKGFFFDLFETIVFPPDRSVRETFLRKESIHFAEGTHPDLLGFPFTFFAQQKGIDFPLLRDRYLTENFGSLDLMLAEYSLLSAKDYRDDVDVKTKKLFRFWNDECYLLNGFPEILRYLKEKNYKLVLISNLQFPFKEVVDRFGLESFFDHRLLSFECGYTKPDPRIFRLALEKTGLLPENVVMVGDNPRSDIMGSRKMGIRPLWFDNCQRFPEGSEVAGVAPLRSLEALFASIRGIG